jgi:hypothetical protein
MQPPDSAITVLQTETDLDAEQKSLTSLTGRQHHFWRKLEPHQTVIGNMKRAYLSIMKSVQPGLGK